MSSQNSSSTDKVKATSSILARKYREVDVTKFIHFVHLLFGVYMGLLPRKPKEESLRNYKPLLFTHLVFPLTGIHSTNPAQPMAPYLNEHGPRLTH